MKMPGKITKFSLTEESFLKLKEKVEELYRNSDVLIRCKEFGEQKSGKGARNMEYGKKYRKISLTMNSWQL